MHSSLNDDSILKVIEGVEVYAPEPLGKMNVLLAGSRIACLQSEKIALGLADVEVIDGKGKSLVPGFIDAHVHILGGGGEGGYASRTPEIMLSDLILGGVTTVVGCLGTDGATRVMPSLVAKARGLEAEGLTTYIYTGSYQVPVVTLTGSVRDDIILIDKVVGVGEIAVSDHRSSQPTFEELARIAANARVGGMLSGKAGVVNIHLGDGDRMLTMIERIIAETEIPAKHFVPTHINRSHRLLEAGIAYVKRGGERYLDLTTSSVSDDPSLSCGICLRRMLDAGVPATQIGFTSDGQGSLPMFNADKEHIGLGVGKVDSLFGEVRKAVQEQGVALQEALQVITSTPASYLRLRRKGIITPGADADLVMLDGELMIDTVFAMGRTMVKGRKVQCWGTFERDMIEGCLKKSQHFSRSEAGPGK